MKKRGIKSSIKTSSTNITSSNIVFTDYKAKKFLKGYAPIAKNVIFDIKSMKKINVDKKFAFPFEFPLVIKIVSDKILHKTDIGAVKIVYSEKCFFEEIGEMIKRAEKFKDAKIMIEEFIQGQELIIGIKKDKTFGHVILFGIGGIFVEVLRDVSFRACSIDMEDADEMINEIKMKKILLGARGKKYDLELLKKVLVSISKIIETSQGKKIVELDINPFILNDKIGKVTDARIVFECSKNKSFSAHQKLEVF